MLRVWRHGDLDPLQDLEYARALREASVPCELHVFMEGDHGLSLADATSAKKDTYVDPHIAHWSDLAVEWLRLVLED